MLYLYLYGRAKDLFKDIPFSEIESHDGAGKNCTALHKISASSAIGNAYSDLPYCIIQGFEVRKATRILNLDLQQLSPSSILMVPKLCLNVSGPSWFRQK